MWDITVEKTSQKTDSGTTVASSAKSKWRRSSTTKVDLTRFTILQWSAPQRRNKYLKLRSSRGTQVAAVTNVLPNNIDKKSTTLRWLLSQSQSSRIKSNYSDKIKCRRQWQRVQIKFLLTNKKEIAPICSFKTLKKKTICLNNIFLSS